MNYSFSDYRKPAVKVEISIAPLIDIMFLLVIFFMVTTIFPDSQGVTVNKPEMDSANSMEDTALTILITENNEYFISDKMVNLDEAYDIVRLTVSQNRTALVIVEADKNSKVETLTNALDKFKKAGAISLAIAATKTGKLKDQ